MNQSTYDFILGFFFGMQVVIFILIWFTPEGIDFVKAVKEFFKSKFTNE